MKLIIIAALNHKRVIGKDNKVPWHVSEDLKRFKRLTTGHTVLMGRKSYESLGKPLSNRRNVVLTSRNLPGVETYPAIEQALEALKAQEKVFVIGGGEIFAQMLEKVDEWYLTIVDQNIEGDVFFPPYEHLIGTKFLLVSREEHKGYKFLDYRRVE
ncbi:MAG: dihydrofolate reductase [Ignavibacteriales bacterium]|nr:dihydrofolate reductase [Ignavibacteriales bacterium]